MGFFDNFGTLKKSGQKVLGTVGAVADTVQQTRTAFGGISDDDRVPYGNMMGNPSGARGRQSIFTDFDDDNDEVETHYSATPVIVSENLRATFRNKARLKVDIISGRIKSDAILKKIAAKLLIQNVGDEEIANRYKDFTPDQIKLLPKETQKIIRNQKHVKAIDAIDLSHDLKEQCVEYFAIEFEDEYLANDGRMPDFSQFNPMELMFQNFNAPYKELMGDLALDLGMELKPKATQFLTALYQKFVKKKINELENENSNDSIKQIETSPELTPIVDESLTSTQGLSYSQIVFDESKDIVQIQNVEKRWASTFKIDGEMPSQETPNYEDFLKSKGLDLDDLTWGNEESLFPNVEARIKFLNEFDKFNAARLSGTGETIFEKFKKAHEVESDKKDDGEEEIEE